MMVFGLVVSAFLALAALGNLFILAGMQPSRPPTPGQRVVSILLNFGTIAWFWFAYLGGIC
jgi:hypothetical protein